MVICGYLLDIFVVILSTLLDTGYAPIWIFSAMLAQFDVSLISTCSCRSEQSKVRTASGVARIFHRGGGGGGQREIFFFLFVFQNDIFCTLNVIIRGIHSSPPTPLYLHSPFNSRGQSPLVPPLATPVRTARRVWRGRGRGRPSKNFDFSLLCLFVCFFL